MTIDLDHGDREGRRRQRRHFYGFENIFGSDKDDVLSGDGDGQQDRGGGGNDTIKGGDGADILIGGTGVNTLSYESTAA